MMTQREELLQRLTVSPDATIKEAIGSMDRAGTGGLALCDGRGQLTGFLTDGDIRRAVLRGVPTSARCDTVANRSPVVANAPISLTAKRSI